ncbi:hypothetical protein BC834DRAFT_967523 [Gloeopeniophorella convolvens]|nr:hypothetical protein BC834DRAFT_967523 [Gloeopeniophorella convolvens]
MQGDTAPPPWVSSREDLDAHITRLQTQLSACPFLHPIRALIAHDLAVLHSARYELAHQKEDLDNAILEYGEALLRGVRNPLHTITTFHKLASLFLTRFRHFGDRDDLGYAISYFRHLSGLPLEAAGLDRVDILGDLARALETRFQLGGRLQDIEDNISIRRTILSNTPPDTDDYYGYMSNLANAVRLKFEQTGELASLSEAIDLNRELLRCCRPDHPALPSFMSNFASSLMRSFEYKGEENDLEEAIALFEKAMSHLDVGHPERRWLIMNLANTWQVRFDRTNNLEHLECAISGFREALTLCPPGQPDRDQILYNLAGALEIRFERLNHMDTLEEAMSHYRASLDLRPPGHVDRYRSLSGLAKTMSWRFLRTHDRKDIDEHVHLQREVLALTPQGHPARPLNLNNLALGLRRQFRLTQNTPDIDEAVELLREGLGLYPDGHPAIRATLLAQGIAFLARFEHSRMADDLNQAIFHFQSSRSITPEGHPEMCMVLSHYGFALYRLYELTNDPTHLEESVSLCQSAVEYPLSPVRLRLEAAESWSFRARAAGHPTTMTAYRQALSLLRRSLDLGPTVLAQHEFIGGRDIDGLRASLSTDAASFAIEIGAYEEAVEMLEQGRAMLWSGMRGLRTPVERLRGVDEALANRFMDVSSALEAVATASADINPHTRTQADEEYGGPSGHQDPLSVALARKRKLSDEMERIVAQVQELPGFEDFWKPAPYSRLQAAAIAGPVIIVNHSRYRSDILIVRYNQPIIHIPTPADFFDKTTSLARRLVETRTKHLLESKQYARVLRQTLEGAYELIARPVLEKFEELCIPEQSRIWWCPTSALGSLPIHAAGPIPSRSADPSAQPDYLCDLYVCSYTPSLSALIASRERTP